ncbi:MAG: hypothetical protein MZW92_42020 [Comamonadaceae bacterium]|nr:hypothetical protein [Comamonadaceae bacterium]
MGRDYGDVDAAARRHPRRRAARADGRGDDPAGRGGRRHRRTGAAGGLGVTPAERDVTDGQLMLPRTEPSDEAELRRDARRRRRGARRTTAATTAGCSASRPSRCSRAATRRR